MRGIWVTLTIGLTTAAAAAPTGGWWIRSETQYTAGLPVWTAVGDADNDGDDDWAIAQIPAPETHFRSRGLFLDDPPMPPPASPETVYGCGILPAIGGALGAPAPQAPGNCRQVEIADLDADGANEILLASDSTLALNRWSSGELQTTATAPLEAALFPGPAFAVGDADNDGRPEIIAGAFGQWSGGAGAPLAMTRLEGHAFTPWAPLATGLATNETPMELVIADADTDGDNDLVFTYRDCEGLSEGVGIQLWDGGGFSPLVRVAMPGLHPRAVAVGDLDADGTGEILVGSCAPLAQAPAGLVTLLECSAGSWSPGVSFTVPGEPSAFLVTDADADGDLDLLFGALDGWECAVHLCTLLGGEDLESDANPCVAMEQLGLVTIRLATGDLTGDGLPELAAVTGAAQTAEIFTWHPAEGEEVAEGIVALTSYDPAFDTNADGMVDATDIVTAVNRGLLRPRP